MTTLPRFGLLATALSWAWWLPLALRADAPQPALWVTQLGFLGPLIAAAIVLAVDRSARERLAALSGWSARGGGRGLLLAILLPLAIALLSLGTFAWSGGTVFPSDGMATFLPLATVVIVLGVLPEELAWRGVGLPAALARNDPLTSAVVVGAWWIAWQLPLFVVPGTYASGLGATEGVLHAITLLGESVLLCALIQVSGSLWPAVAFRAITVLAGEWWQMPPAAEWHRGLWTILATLVVLSKPGAFGLLTSRRHPGG